MPVEWNGAAMMTWSYVFVVSASVAIVHALEDREEDESTIDRT